ncbi:hypothetical protein AMYX_08650 [Anaeromyxobacter diazotrophicus]|uniref:Uncharacterized protein n=1 Tax=Anaeromyxobacter diazotrophicus TaxID=2590199 RepID=A0A7I9VI95_9BACT|nr:hypothetical protein AMYX_08650 [Anaeromyxobacter diazotrophicus]
MEPGRAAVRVAERHEVDERQRAGRGLEARLEDVGAGEVPARGGPPARRRDGEVPARGGVEQAVEDGRAVEARPAQPVDAPLPRDQRRRPAVPEDGVIADGGLAGAVYQLPNLRRARFTEPLRQ